MAAKVHCNVRRCGTISAQRDTGIANRLRCWIRRPEHGAGTNERSDGKRTRNELDLRKERNPAAS
eukprot:1145264-Pelagomonas_calceolata.AAC.3